MKVVARDVGLSPAQLAIAWLLLPDIMVIPKTTHVTRLVENLSALELQLDAATIAALERLITGAYPAPHRWRCCSVGRARWSVVKPRPLDGRQAALPRPHTVLGDRCLDTVDGVARQHG